MEQVCAEAARQATAVLAELADPAWPSAWVEGVSPDPDVSSLAIVVTVDVADTAALSAARDRLAGLIPRLRCELAAAIQRQRTPRLRMLVFPAREILR